MAKQQDPRWQLDLRPVAPGRTPAGAEAANDQRATAAQRRAVAASDQHSVDDVVRLLTNLSEAVDGLRDAVDKIGKRLTAVERAMRERDGEVSQTAARPLREAKPVRPIPPLRLESRTRASRPRAVNEGDGSGR
ncbi:MAG: hypothetical protein ACTHK4_17350 [Mycobacteriales bacterium]